jgi:hypothetical protein
MSSLHKLLVYYPWFGAGWCILLLHDCRNNKRVRFILHCNAMHKLRWNLLSRLVIMILYSYFSAQCLPCNIACATCAGPANNAAQCTTCALGYFRFNPATDPCYDCFSACSACTDLTSTGCTNCAYGYFFLNNECLSQCPPGFYSQ